MSEIIKNEAVATPTRSDSEKPVQDSTIAILPPFPDPTDDDFEDDISEEERNFYKQKFPDINDVKTFRLHCTACDRHLGCAARNESRMRSHPMLRTLICNTCHTFYNSGEFEKGEDGSELYCRWCGQGGQVYCCSDCQHVFCAKCIKRNMGTPKIKEIEGTDDWKCFKCDSKCLWDLRALCWALLRFCDLKNKIAYNTQDQKLKELYQQSCAVDDSLCCKSKMNRKKPREDPKRVSAKVEKDLDISIKKEKATSAAISKIPSTIQVKKFASIVVDDGPKKAQKRSASPKPRMFTKNSPTQPNTKFYSSAPILSKKMKLMGNPPIPINPVRIQAQPPNLSYMQNIRPKITLPSLIVNKSLNGFNTSDRFSNSTFNSSSPYNMGFNPMSDNINLSLEELTQGLDFGAVAAMAANDNAAPDGDVVCTPDFPLEPLCEVTEENTDDDVQCISGPKVSKKNTPTPATRAVNSLPDLAPENIVQMTENDVTVNPTTGGLKFRVDPQTLSSKKMYRLPDGRIFAINPNPNMPGGYSATIVAVSDKSAKAPPKGATYAARLSAVTPALPQPKTQNQTPKGNASNRRLIKIAPKPPKAGNKAPRECDLNVPIEWYRYNLIDAVDALEYSLSRLQKLKKEATTTFLRTRTVDEMRSLHRVLERALNTSTTRFQEIKENLNKGIKNYIAKKRGSIENVSDDDDDVEILNDVENDDPIFIDENSLDSITDENRPNKTQEVDLTGRGSCELNDGNEKSVDHTSGSIDKSPFGGVNGQDNQDSSKVENDEDQIVTSSAADLNAPDDTDNAPDKVESQKPEEKDPDDVDKPMEVDKVSASESDNADKEQALISESVADKVLEQDNKNEEKEKKPDENNSLIEDADLSGDVDNNQDPELNEDKNQDADMTDAMIDNLLKDDLGEEEIGENLNLLDIPELQET